jgi:hypothetical protein
LQKSHCFNKYVVQKEKNQTTQLHGKKKYCMLLYHINVYKGQMHIIVIFVLEYSLFSIVVMQQKLQKKACPDQSPTSKSAKTKEGTICATGC